MNDTLKEPLAVEPLMTPEQVARQLVVSENTLTVWRSTKRQSLQFVKIGGLVRYPPSDVVSAPGGQSAPVALLFYRFEAVAARGATGGVGSGVNVV